MSLAFLSKKSFHTANLSNQEKVWMAEQQKAAEEAKTKELSKQIQLEREREEMEKISGKVSSKIDRGIDWMYQGGVSYDGEAAKRKEEEYLLGKEFVPDEAGGEGPSVGVDAVISNAALKPAESAGVQEPETEAMAQDWNEEFRLRYEDPMFLVNQRQTEKKRDVEKKQALYDQVISQKSSSRHKPREKKSKHRERRHGKSRKRSRRDRSRSRSRSPPRRRGRSPSPSPSPPRHRSSRHERHHRSKTTSSKPSHHQSSSSHKHHSRHRTSPSPPHKIHHEPHHTKKYGLQGPSSLPINPDALGPDPSLLASKQRKKQEEISSRHSHKHSRRNLDPEAKAEALESMRKDAHRRTSQMQKSISGKIPEEERSCDRDPLFLKEVAQRTHGVSNKVSMAERVQRNRHTNQRLDVE